MLTSWYYVSIRHRSRHSEESRRIKKSRRRGPSHRSRERYDSFSRLDERARFAGVRRETLLHGSYSDYLRDYQRSRHSTSAVPMRSSHFPPRGVDLPPYYALPVHSGGSRSSYHRPVDPYAAACDEFLRRTQSDRTDRGHMHSRYRSSRRR